MKQLIAPNLTVVGYPDYCLAYVENVFGRNYSGPGEYDAWQAYLNTKFKHTDTVPNNAVPIWFSWTGTLDGVTQNWGHVAVYTPGAVYTNPLSGSGHRIFGSIPDLEKAYGVQYVGWSEDLSNLRIVQEDAVSTVGEVEFNDLFRAFFVDINLVTQDDRKRWIGAETNTVIRAMAADPRFINQAPAGVVPYSGPQLFVKS